MRDDFVIFVKVCWISCHNSIRWTSYIWLLVCFRSSSRPGCFRSRLSFLRGIMPGPTVGVQWEEVQIQNLRGSGTSMEELHANGIKNECKWPQPVGSPAKEFIDGFNPGWNSNKLQRRGNECPFLDSFIQ
jgi:hypothetical protein